MFSSGLSPAGSHGLELGQQALVYELLSQAWLKDRGRILLPGSLSPLTFPYGKVLDHSLSGLSPGANLPMGPLPGTKSPDNTTVRVTETLKPLHHVKEVISGGAALLL